jgi:hypothetical protein
MTTAHSISPAPTPACSSPTRLQFETAAELDALLPSILDKTFEGGLL